MRELHSETTNYSIIFWNGKYKLGVYNKKTKTIKIQENLSLKEIKYIIKSIENGQ